MARESIRTICPFCGVGCSLYITTKDNKATGLDYVREAPVNEGALCSKGNASIEILNHRDRLRHPMVKVYGRWKQISWDEAFSIIAENIGFIRDTHGPDSLGFFCSAKCTNEENYLFQKLARMIGTNNVDHCARL